MTADEFVIRIVGVPWRKWCADWSAVDCFGLLVLYHREVLGVDPGDVPNTEIGAGFAAARGWAACGPEPGAACFMAWRDGAPTHCGLLLEGGMVLHAEGNDDAPGSVRVSRLAAIERLYGPITFHRFTPC